MSTPRRVLGVVLAAAVLLVVAAGPASAHVTVGTDEEHQGASDALLTFRVPTERSGTSTVKVQITFPARTPLASVMPAAKPGWTITTTSVTFPKPISTDDGEFTQGIGQVTYTAATPAAAIPEDRFDTFQILVGPLPKGATALAFPTLQTYADGQVSAWVEPSTPGAEPEHPAPSITLVPAEASASPAPAASVAAVAPATVAEVADDARTARTLGVVGILLGALGLLTGGLALARARRTATPSDR